MRNAKLAAMMGGALVLGVGLSGASPPIHDATMPAVGASHAAVDQLKVLGDRVQKLETADAQKNAQIQTLISEVASQKLAIGTLQEALATVQSQMGDYVPASGPGNCASHGYTNAGSLPANPALLVYTWGTCKTQ
jgi:uncharacterized coiled-coil protein SlyX